MRAHLVSLGMCALLCGAACRTGGTDDSSSSSSGGNGASDAGVRRDAGDVETPDAGDRLDAGPRADARVIPTVSTRESLRWRTGRAFEHHLMAALELTENEV